MTERDIEIILGYAENNMNVSETARKMFFHRNTLEYHLDKVKKKTGLDPRKFYDLLELVKKYGSENH